MTSTTRIIDAAGNTVTVLYEPPEPEPNVSREVVAAELAKLRASMGGASA